MIWALTLSKKRAMAHRVHYFMGVLIIFKALTVLSQAGMYHYLRTTGVPDGWNVAYYIFKPHADQNARAKTCWHGAVGFWRWRVG